MTTEVPLGENEMNSRNCLHGALALLLLAVPVECAKRSMQEEQAVSDIPRVHYLLGKQHLEQGDWQAAADQFQLALSLNPEYVPAYEGLGLIHLEQGEFLKAQQYFEEARRRDDTYAPLYIGLGRLLSTQGDNQRALDPLQRALALEPGNADAFFYLGKTFFFESAPQLEHEFKDVGDKQDNKSSFKITGDSDDCDQSSDCVG